MCAWRGGPLSSRRVRDGKGAETERGKGDVGKRGGGQRVQINLHHQHFTASLSYHLQPM